MPFPPATSTDKPPVSKSAAKPAPKTAAKPAAKAAAKKPADKKSGGKVGPVNVAQQKPALMQALAGLQNAK